MKKHLQLKSKGIDKLKIFSITNPQPVISLVQRRTKPWNRNMAFFDVVGLDKFVFSKKK